MDSNEKIVKEKNIYNFRMAQIHHKAITVIYTKARPRQFLTVKDKRFSDWTFVTGGCRKREVFFPLKTALRELEEETRGVLRMDHGEYKYFYFVDAQYPLSVYHVYLIEVDIPQHIMNFMVMQFDKQMRITEERRQLKMSVKRSYDENSQMSWDTWGEFMKKLKWPLITRSILNNHRFYDLLDNTDLKIPFDLRKVRHQNVVARPIQMESGSAPEPCVAEKWQVQRSSRKAARLLHVDGGGDQ